MLKQSTDSRAKQLIPAAWKIAALRPVAEARIAKMEPEALSALLQEHKLGAAIARAVDLYCASGSFAQANSRYDQVIKPILDELTEAQIERILVANKEESADFNGATSFTNFAKYIYEKKVLPQKKVLELIEDRGGMSWLADQLRAAKKKVPDDDDIPF
jgi:hypothetical protein